MVQQQPSALMASGPGAPQIIQKTIVTKVVSLGKAQKGEGWDLQTEPGMGSQYPLHWRGKDWNEVNGLSANMVVTIVAQRGKVKENKTGKYETDFFWDVVTIARGAGPAAPAMQAREPQDMPDAPFAEPPPAQPQMTPYEDGERGKRRSIERQQALAQAVAYAGHRLAHPGPNPKDIDTAAILTMAEAMYVWIQSGMQSKEGK